jgi:ankyrin repeat protein
MHSIYNFNNLNFMSNYTFGVVFFLVSKNKKKISVFLLQFFFSQL